MRYRRPDTRPRWDDPDLKSQIFPHYPPLPADWIQKNAELAMAKDAPGQPHWKLDRTYDLKKRPLKVRGKKK